MEQLKEEQAASLMSEVVPLARDMVAARDAGNLPLVKEFGHQVISRLEEARCLIAEAHTETVARMNSRGED